MRKGFLITLLVILLVLIAVAVALLWARPTVLENRRAAFSDQILAALKQDQLELSLPGIPAVSWENTAFSEFSLSSGEEDTITGFGVLEIPALSVEIPVVAGQDRYGLRAAAGWLPSSAKAGETGCCVIFGYRMNSNQWCLNRLGELKKGNEVTLHCPDGNTCIYTVTGSQVVAAENVLDAIGNYQDSIALVLMTDLPAGIGSHRLIVYASVDTSVG